MANTVKRVNYYDHQFLRAPDFTDEQTYHLNSRRLHNSTLHTWGVVQGLVVTVTTGGTGTAITVSAGMAIDSAGREIVLPADSNLELGGEAAGSALIVTIAYAEVQSDPTTEAGGPGNTRVSEFPNLTFTQVVPADKSTTLILARVPRTATGLGALDTADRKQAGVVLGSTLTVNSLTLNKDGVAAAGWPALSCSAANQTALSNSGLTVSGSVGIGPAAPDRDLTISGAGAAGTYANIKNASHQVLLGVDTAAVLSAMTASDLQIRTDNVTRMTIAKGDGNTQIQSTLIVGPVPFPTAAGRITVTGAAAELGFARRSLGAWPATPAAGDRYVWYNPDGNAKLYTEAKGDLLTVTPNGYLGIGTVPACTLDVKSSNHIKLGLEGNGGGQLIITNAPGDNCIYLEAFNTAGNGSAAQLHLTGAGNSNVPQLYLGGDQTIVSGSLGIGTVPSCALDVRSSNVIKLGLQGNGGGQLVLANNPNDNCIFLEAFNAAGNGSANVLYLTGAQSANIASIVLAANTTTCQGNALKPGGGAWGTTSDESLKTDIKPMTEALDKLLGLRGVTFQWKDPEKFPSLTGTQMGFIAQEVETVFPEWVGLESEGLKTVSVRGFEALTVEALRELRQAVQEVKDAVSTLQTRRETKAR